MTHVPALSLRGVSKRMAALEVLAGVDLEVRPGSLVALLGPSGAGKSTLFHLVAGLYQPDAGTIAFDGVAVGDRRGLAAYQPQKDLLLPWRTALGNATLGARLAGRDRAAARRLAAAALARVGLAGFEDYYPAALSGGMRQRVALARTLLLSRGLLLLADRVVLLTPRPARVLAEVAVPLPRPRRLGDPALARLEGRLLDLVTRRAAGDAAVEAGGA